MINEENKEAIIEQYLEKKLTRELLQEFEEKMETDAAFRREVALQRKIVRNVQTVGREQLRAQLKTIHQEMLADPVAEEENNVVHLFRNKMLRYAIAATIALLIVSGIVFVLLQDTTNAPILASLPIEAIGEDGTTRGTRGMIEVMIYPPEDTLTLHYQFTDTLKLYGPFNAEQIHIFYNLDTDHYLLQAEGKEYELRKSAAIMHLEEE